MVGVVVVVQVDWGVGVDWVVGVVGMVVMVGVDGVVVVDGVDGVVVVDVELIGKIPNNKHKSFVNRLTYRCKPVKILRFCKNIANAIASLF